VVINYDQGRLVGAIDARDLRASLSTSGLPLNSNSFADILNSHGDVGDLLRLPGFVSTHFATPRTTNGEALKQMDGANLSWLCVVDDGDFKGIVDRFHVANAIILAVAGKLGAAGSE
jgi:CBS domain-containing protein